MKENTGRLDNAMKYLVDAGELRKSKAMKEQDAIGESSIKKAHLKRTL